MNNYIVKWHDAAHLSSVDQSLVCRQVYVWLVTRDQKIVIVSKNGKQWQFPGGKPEAGESHLQTAVREVFEETGVDVSSQQDGLQFFGYYIVREQESNEAPYTQLRFFLKLPVDSDELRLHSAEEDVSQEQHDVIKHVQVVTIDEALELIPWLVSSPEFQTVEPLLL